MKKVSVIVPVYNVEEYIDKCLDTLTNQTFKDYELIVINDGSSDNSESIILDYQKKYPKLIKYYKKENGGLSSARNYGIEKSTGEYLMFIDSDDYVSNDMVEKLYNKIDKEQSDMVICNYYRVTCKGKFIKNYNINPGTTNIKSNPEIILNKQAAWNKIYKKELFSQNKFDEGKYYEDLRLIPKLYLECKKIAFINDFCYYYIERDNSIMKDINLEKNYEIVEAIDSLITYYKSHNKYERYKEEIEFMMLDNIMVSTFDRIICSTDNIKNNLKRYWDFIDNNFPNYKKNKYIKTWDKKRKLIYFLNSHKLYFITKLIFKMKG